MTNRLSKSALRSTMGKTCPALIKCCQARPAIIKRAKRKTSSKLKPSSKRPLE